MRSLKLLSLVLFAAAFSFAQSADRGVAGYCPYGCGPYIPLLTTPVLSFTTVSPNPTGATNATGGLIAGARNSTLSEVAGNTNAVYTEPVWNSGGGIPLISPAVNVPFGGMSMSRRNREPAPQQNAQPPSEPWIYFSSAEELSPVAAAGSAKHPTTSARTFSNDDIQKLNEQNGNVHYDGKTEKIQ
jgi:hypothetical protein